MFFSCNIFSQQYNLIVSSRVNSEKSILEKIKYKKIHNDSISIKTEIKNIISSLKNNGFFLATVKNIIKKDKSFTAYLNLNKRVEKASLTFNDKDLHLTKGLLLKKNILEIPIKKLQSTLLYISKKIENQGKSFSKLQLKGIKIRNSILYGNIYIQESNKRTINKTIIKGYENFPEKFIKNYLKIKRNTLFNKEKLSSISSLSKKLIFADEIKPPEVLFTKDSTLLFLYLKKTQANSFDALVNFASKENGKLLFNGHIDLKLNNVLNSGESLNLFWNSIGNERQEFKIETKIPYILNSKFSPELVFSIYKQDSTFLTTNFKTTVNYDLNEKSKIGVFLNSDKSQKLIENDTNNIFTLSNFFIGAIYNFSIPKNDFLKNNLFYFDITFSAGKRNIKQEKTNQIKITLNTSYIFELNSRNSIFIKNNTGYLNSSTYIDNELFRIGGQNSIRGFNEQSIFAKNYSYFNLEYRYLTSETSYLYTISDIARITTLKKGENLLSLGAGYLFRVKNTQININMAINASKNSQAKITNTQLSISWINYF